MSHKSLTTLTLASLCLVAGSLGAQTILDETWANGNRDTQDLPNSSQWFNSSTGDNITVADNKMTVTDGNQILTYFTNEAGSPVTVGVGQALTISYNISLLSPKTGGHWLYIGLFNSGDSTATTQRIDADEVGTSNDAYKGYTGYRIFERNVTTGSTAFYKRTSATSAALMSVGTAYTPLTSEGGSGWGGYSNNAIYSGIIQVVHNDDDTITLSQSVYSGEELLYTVTATDVTATDSGPAYTQFDALAFYLQSGGANSMTLSNLKIELGTIPEPSTFATLSALAAVGVLLVSRRRKR